MSPGFLYVILGSISLTIGDLFMKIWVGNNSCKDFSIGFICYSIGMIFLALSFKYKNIAIASMMLVLFNIITLLIVSWVIFKEPMSIKEIIGILLGISAIILLETN